MAFYSREFSRTRSFPTSANDNVWGRTSLVLYGDHVRGITSKYYDLFSFIFDSLNAKKLYRIKANLITRTPRKEIGIFHTDIPSNLKSPQDEYTTSILYMNTNDGYTEFENGHRVESVANRFITFPEVTNHRGTSCTDKRTRTVINFNYLT